MAGEKNLIGDEIGGLQELSNPSNYRFVFIESGNWNNGGDTLARFLMASSDTCMVCTSLRNWYQARIIKEERAPRTQQYPHQHATPGRHERSPPRTPT
jgi:hypothetical protein